jgi:hypothetical protein
MSEMTVEEFARLAAENAALRRDLDAAQQILSDIDLGIREMLPMKSGVKILKLETENAALRAMLAECRPWVRCGLVHMAAEPEAQKILARVDALLAAPQ